MLKNLDMMILVDEKDREIGEEEKVKSHIWPAKRHRAFSVFVFNSKGEMLIHKRASEKKTWPGFWTNACCSHPRKGETTEQATSRRLKEELGFTCPVRHLFTFEYSAQYDKTYGEHEVDWVFVGHYDGPIKANPNEISEWKYVPVDKLHKDIMAHPDAYTPWFKEAFERVVKQFRQ